MKKHIVKLNKKLYMSIQCAVIGVHVAGDAAGLFMTWSDRKLKQILAGHSTTLLLNSRYKDDINILVKTNSSYANI